MGFFTGSKAPIHRAEQAHARQRLFGAQMVEEAEHAQARTRAQEEARLSVLGQLGAPGTYDLPGTEPAGAAPTGAGVTPGSIYAEPTGPGEKALSVLNVGTGYGSGTKRGSVVDLNRRYLGTNYEDLLGERTDILDPDAFAAEVSKTAGFRMRSRLTAEAEQLLAREGDEWTRLNQSVMGTIAEGHLAARAEENRMIKNAAAKGGTARRNAFILAQQAQVREQTNRARIQDTWEANLRLDSYIKQNANFVEEGNIRFLDNLPQLRDSYVNTMNRLTEMMASTALPAAASASLRGYEARAKARKEPSFLGKLISGGAAIIGGALTGGLGGAVLGGLSAVAGSTVPMSQENMAAAGQRVGSFARGLFDSGEGRTVTVPASSGVTAPPSLPFEPRRTGEGTVLRGPEYGRLY